MISVILYEKDFDYVFVFVVKGIPEQLPSP